MLVNALVVCASALEELWTGGLASGGVSIDWTVDWTTRINASPRECVSHPGAICKYVTTKHTYNGTTKSLQVMEHLLYFIDYRIR